MKKLWSKLYDNFIVKILVIKPLKYGSYFLSHGGFHLIMCVTVFVITFLWAQSNLESTTAKMHDIGFNIKKGGKDYSKPRDLYLTFIIDSDTIMKNTNGKYRSCLNVYYYYPSDYEIEDSMSQEMTFSPTLINISSNPLLKDVEVVQDSVYSSTVRNHETGAFETTEVTYDTFCSFQQDSMINITIEEPTRSKEDGKHPGELQVVRIYSNDWGLAEGDDSYNYFVGLEGLPSDSREGDAISSINICFEFGNISLKSDFYHTDKKILYQYIFPEPDVINNGYIAYFSQEKIKRIIENHGIIIEAKDIDAMNKNNKKAIIYSVLVGTGAALFFDILIQLIRELRNVNRKHDKKKQKEEENDDVSSQS